MADRRTTSLKRKTISAAGGCLLRVFIPIAGWLPAKTADRFGAFIGRFAMSVAKKQRERTISNLKMCFPDWDDAKVRKTARQVFEHFGRTTMRFLRAFKTRPSNVDELTRDEGFEHLEAALAQGRGALVITAHFGNWEWAGLFLHHKGYEVSAIARDANDRTTTNLVNKIRAQEGVEIFPRGSAARPVLRSLAANRIVMILPDQNHDELYVPFFGFPAGTVAGPAVLHLRSGAPMVTCFCFENETGGYTVRVSPIEIPPLVGERMEDAARIMTEVNAAIERIIREHPEQWLWMHDRWKLARQKGMLPGG